MEAKAKQIFESLITKTLEKKIKWSAIGTNKVQAVIGDVKISFFQSGVTYYFYVRSKDNERLMMERFRDAIDPEYYKKAGNLMSEIKKQLVNYDEKIDDLLKNLNSL